MPACGLGVGRKLEWVLIVVKGEAVGCMLRVKRVKNGVILQGQ